MGATKFEFRFRMLINAAIVVLGFMAPWFEMRDIARRIPLLEWLALESSRAGVSTFTAATHVLIVVASLLAAAAAVMRVWGAAYLGSDVVQSAGMRAGSVVADGPYRHVRNPLYIGLWCMFAALSFLMPPTGALVAVLLSVVFLLRLILGEEAYLSAKLGDPYQAYLRAVPRLLPRLRTNLPRSRGKPRWATALLAELTPIGVFLAIAVLSWTYNNRLVERAILISFGVSLMARALLPAVRQTPD